MFLRRPFAPYFGDQRAKNATTVCQQKRREGWRQSFNTEEFVGNCCVTRVLWASRGEPTGIDERIKMQVIGKHQTCFVEQGYFDI